MKATAFGLVMALAAAAACTDRGPERRAKEPQRRVAVTSTSAPASTVISQLAGPVATQRQRPPRTSTTSTTQPPQATTGRCDRSGNGGASDVGVTSKRIRVYVSAVLDGPKRGLVERAATAVRAVADDANHGGGICGRLLELQFVNDGYRNPAMVTAAAAHTFVSMAAPLDDGFAARLRDGTIDQAGMPIVGTDGVDIAQSSSPWVWPLGPSTAAVTRIAVDHAYRTAGARTFALVHDSKYAFGTDAANAFRAYVARLPGAVVRHVQPLDPDRPSYGTEQAAYRERCADEQCDVMLLALLPDTEVKWGRTKPPPPRVRYDAVSPAPLRATGTPVPFDNPHARPLWQWTGFTPPVAPFLDDPDVRRYREDVGDNNPFVIGAYVGAQALVAALRAAGPNLTRARLQAALDRLVMPSGIVGVVDWRPPDRLALSRARALILEDDGVARDVSGGWGQDPG